MYQDDQRWSTAAPASLSRWTRDEDLRFEQALVGYPDGSPDWDAISRHLPGKSPAEIARHYGELLHDVEEIEAGRVEPPSYSDDSEAFLDSTTQISFGSGKNKSDPDRKKGTPWTEEEHRLFLLGLQKYGKGDWRSISRNYVVTRTPTQVASHAQKYYLRQGSGKKERKRSSIHDITSADSSSARPPERNNCLLSPPPPAPSNHSSPPQHYHQQQQFNHFNHHHNMNSVVPISQSGHMGMGYQHYGFRM